MALHSPDGSHSPQIIMKYSAALLFVLVSSGRSIFHGDPWPLHQEKNVDLMFFIWIELGLASFQCPKKDGQYSDEKYCDKFYVCKEGVAEEQLCPDGLVFDQTKRQINKCDYPYNVDCEDRDEIFRKSSNSWVLNLSRLHLTKYATWWLKFSLKYATWHLSMLTYLSK